MSGGRQVGGGAKLPPKPHPVLLHPPDDYLPIEDKISHNNRELQVLLSDHREMSASHSALKHDLSLAHQQLRQLSAAALQIREDGQTRVKDLYQRSLSLDSQFRGVEALREEHSLVIEDIKKLTESKLQLAAQFKAIHSDLQLIKSEASQVDFLRADFDRLRSDLLKGRAALESEKKTRATNLEYYEAMEKNIMSMQCEIERLHAEKRARASVTAAASNPNPPYMANYTSPAVGYEGGPYPAHYPMHQATIPAEGASPALNKTPPGGHDPFDRHQVHVPKG